MLHNDVVLSGVMQSHSALKEHTSILEATLAQKEGSAVQLTSHVHEQIIHKDKELNDLKTKVKDLEDAIAKEKLNVKDIKKQVGS